MNRVSVSLNKTKQKTIEIAIVKKTLEKEKRDANLYAVYAKLITVINGKKSCQFFEISQYLLNFCMKDFKTTKVKNEI